MLAGQALKGGWDMTCASTTNPNLQSGPITHPSPGHGHIYLINTLQHGITSPLVLSCVGCIGGGGVAVPPWRFT